MEINIIKVDIISIMGVKIMEVTLSRLRGGRSNKIHNRGNVEGKTCRREEVERDAVGDLERIGVQEGVVDQSTLRREKEPFKRYGALCKKSINSKIQEGKKGSCRRLSREQEEKRGRKKKTAQSI